MEDTPRYPGQEPLIWDLESLDALLIWAHELGASDINLVPGNGIWIRLHGFWYEVTRRPLSGEEPGALLDQITRSASSSARIIGGDYQDLGYEIKLDRTRKLYFRVNATGCRYQWGVGTNMVLRVIPGVPPRLEDLDVQRGILDSCFPKNGLVLITGVMGSGKSTLLAAMLRWIIENQRRFVATFEAPIEFDLMAIPNKKSPVVQSTVGDELSGGYGFENIKSFADAPRNSTRRACDVILVGESRDRVTLRGMIEISEIGVAAYSTVHTRSVEDTPSRIINVFDEDDRRQIAMTMLSGLRLIVHQELVPRAGGGRVALREYLAFDEEIRNDLVRRLDIECLTPRIHDWLLRRYEETKHDESVKGLPLYEDARLKFEAGVIEKPVYEEIMRRFDKL